MKNTNQIWLKLTKTVMLGVFSMATLPLAFADDVAGAAAAVPAPAVSVWKQCAAENDITLPAKGSGVKLAPAQKQAMKACVKPKREAAAQVCQAAKTSPQDWKSFKTCMKAAGFHHRHGRHHKHMNQEEPQLS